MYGFTLPTTFVAIATLMLATPVHAQEATKPTKAGLERVRVSDDGKTFILADSGKTFTPWGFNFVGEHGRIVEEYWEQEWPSVEKDFRQMRELGANVVRLHLQVGSYMKTENDVDEDELRRLQKLLDLAERHQLYLDLTGLGCYHAAKVPKWFDELSESKRWDVQARFWEATAKTCADHSAVFCYNLMNEPVITKPKENDHPWLTGELGGMHFVQRISNAPGNRNRDEIAEAWVRKMVQAIRKHDRKGLITVGVIPWAHVWPNAKPVFYSPQALKHLDFVSVHFYPKKGEVEKAVKAVATYDLGKPIVVEEIFPLSCSIDELDQFIDASGPRVDGWISHYFGKTIPQHAAGAQPGGALSAKFLEYWKAKGMEVQRSRE